MTNDEKISFCGNITKAASDLGMGLSKPIVDKDMIRFEFYDPAVKVTIRGATASNEQDALVNACRTLVNFMQMQSG